jgi:UDP-N-acetylmuramoyl-tripeptide--D-alanyl-D-alanine ligase
MWASEVAMATGGVLVGGDVLVDGATQDSRTVTPDCLFVPLVAERDGHDFVDGAMASGAAAALWHRDEETDAGPVVRVDDTAVALRALGSTARRSIGAADGLSANRTPARVVGITGSVGKTSTKDLLAAVLARAGVVHASDRSFNNAIGVPLTLLGAPAAAAHVVVEMGARREGDITDLADIARPDVGVLTTVASSHTGVFGSLEAVARTKGELFDGLPPDGCAIVHADVSAALAQAVRARCPVLTFGDAGEVRARDIRLDDVLRPTFRLESPWGRTEVTLEARGAHMVSNALAAAAVGLVEGVGLDNVAAGLAEARLSPWRMEVVTGPSGCTVVNDAYNANPVSTAAALDALAGLPGSGRRIAVLGVMAELGDGGPAAHVAVAGYAADLGVEVLAVGTDRYGTDVLDDADAALAALVQRALVPGDAVLVKGSRVAGLEAVVDGLLGG